MKRLVLWLISGLLLAGCPPNKDTPVGQLVSTGGKKPIPVDLVGAAQGTVAGQRFEDDIELVGFVLPKTVGLGMQAEVTLWWRLLGTTSVRQGPKVFVHALVPGAEMRSAGRDHALVPSGVDPLDLAAGDVIEDRFVVAVPKDLAADKLRVLVGLYEKKDRYEVTRGEQDGHDRVLLDTMTVEGAPAAFPTVKAKKRTAEITIDGKLDETDWAAAQRVGPFISYRGQGRIKGTTHARLLWDDDNLYVAFECDDEDIHTPYTQRDDPLYESEAVEIFIDADGDKDEYVELQAAPNDVHFDAAFKGGRRKNFDTSYNVNYESKATLQGTLNDNGDTDTSWVSEWRIPIAELRDVPSPPKRGTTWQINMFRLDRIRRGDKVIKNEASAWSSPFSGDFHNLDRFGTLVFD